MVFKFIEFCDQLEKNLTVTNISFLFKHKWLFLENRFNSYHPLIL